MCSGSSVCFARGFATYSTAAKDTMLGLDALLIEQYGAVTEPGARAMAAGALARSQAHLSVAVTGVAGPSGGSRDKPVGTVWFAWAGQAGIGSKRHLFAGDRSAVRQATVAQALAIALRLAVPGYD